jgi:DNA-binding beta-propeller fold protein YncE
VVRFLVTSAGRANGGGYGAVLGFDCDGKLLGAFGGDPRITDPRGLCLDPSGALVYINSGEDRVLVLDRIGNVVRDSGPIPGLDPGGGTFGPDGRYYVGMRRARTILAMPAALDGDTERALPAGIVPFPRGFGFAGDGRLYLASGVGPSGEGDNTIVAFDREGVLRQRRLVADPELSPLDLTIAPNGNIVVASGFRLALRTLSRASANTTRQAGSWCVSSYLTRRSSSSDRADLDSDRLITCTASVRTTSWSSTFRPATFLDPWSSYHG